MRLTRTAVKRPIGTGVLCAAVVVVGAFALDRLPVDLLPEVDFPRISVVTQYPGVGPEEVEALLTRPIEQAVRSVAGIRDIEAVSSEGLSRVQLQFAWGVDLDAAVNDVRSYLDRLANSLPVEADRPVVYKFDLASVPIANIGLIADGDPRRLRYLADEVLAPRFERVEGVAAVTVRGGRVREVRVELDAGKLIAEGITAAEVSAALGRDNRNVSAGDMRDTGREVLVRAIGEWVDASEIEEVVVARRAGRPIYVRDLATVRDTFREVRSELWIDGVPGITMRVSKQPGTNTISAVEGLRAELERINREHDGQLRVVLLSNAADYIRSAVTNVQTAALFGGLLAILVLLFFLHDLRSTFLIALAIPLSVVATFALMFFADYSLNVISFGGLALGIGLLVDNAIVILENIHRKREEGLSRSEAAIEGAREVGPAVVAGTLTTIAVFAPVVFLAGFAGVFFGEMAAVVVFALACSLAMALTLVPSFAARLMRRRRPRQDTIPARVGGAIEGGVGAVERAYQRLLRRCLRAPWFVIAVALVLFAGSFKLASEVGVELMPETDEGLIDVDVDLAVGTPLERTSVVIRDVEQRIRAVVRPEEAAALVTSAGPTNWWRPGGGHEGEVEVVLSPISARDRGVSEIMAEVRGVVSGIPDARIRIRARSQNFLMRLMRGSAGERLVVEVRGYDLDTAAKLAQQISEIMAGIEGVADVRVDRQDGLEERTVHVDSARAADVGLTRGQVAETLETYVLGRVATRMRDAGEEIDVRVVLRDADRKAIERLAGLPILTADGSAVPLSTVATVGGRRGPTTIARRGQERVLNIFGGISARPLSEVVGELDEALARLERPAGFTVSIAGEQEQQDETFAGLFVGIILAVLLVYAVMAVQFESLRLPLVVMAALPFGFVGVVLTLLLTGTTFNMNSFLGAIALVGIAVNNAIVLVDYINLLRREQGFGLVQAVLEGGRRRLRPILMTTLTTGLAMLPLAFGIGEGGEVQAPLARVIVGGLLASTVVTLVIVPSLYYLAERGRERVATVPAGAAVA